MITIRKATKKDFDLVIHSRFEMLRVVNENSPEETFNENFIETTKKYFRQNRQTTILALDKQDDKEEAKVSFAP